MKVCAASVRATEAEVVGNVITVESVPDRVSVLVAANVLPSVRVRVEPVAGAVSATLLIVVAVATPRVGVTMVQLVTRQNAPVPETLLPRLVKIPDVSGRVKILLAVRPVPSIVRTKPLDATHEKRPEASANTRKAAGVDGVDA